MSTSGGQGSEPGTQTVKAVVLIAVVVLVGVLLLHHSPGSSGSATATTAKHHTTTTTTAAPGAASPTTSTTITAPAAVKLQVLNGLLTGNLAGQWSNKLKTTYGYDTLPPDNATSRVTASAIYVMTPGFVPEAEKLAQQVGLPPTIVNQTIPPPPTAPIPPHDQSGANLVLVVGPELVASA